MGSQPLLRDPSSHNRSAPTHPPSPVRVHRPTTCADVAPPHGCPRPGPGWEGAPPRSRPGLVAIFRSVLSRECCSPGSQASVSYRGQFLTRAARIPGVPSPASRFAQAGDTAGAGPGGGRGAGPALRSLQLRNGARPSSRSKGARRLSLRPTRARAWAGRGSQEAASALGSAAAGVGAAGAAEPALRGAAAGAGGRDKGDDCLL
nr:CDC42 small effector protein 2 isoform X2 [Pan paniscus]